MIRNAFHEAIATALANPLRTALGAVAVAFAVATVTVTVTALDAVTAFTRQTTAKIFGSDTFVIAQIGSPGQISRRELEDKLERNLPIRREDYRFLSANAASQVRYAASAQRQAGVAVGSRKMERVSITGTTSELAQIRDVEVRSGRFLQPADERQAAQVAFIGAEVASELFPTASALGQELRIAGRGFRVIGIQALIGGSGGASLDRYVWIPLTTFERVFGEPATLQVFARAVMPGSETAAQDQSAAALRAKRRLQPGEADNFDIVLPTTARSFVATISGRVGSAALPISLMAIVAAVVVVANTTLASVSQRIREIGVRRAVGATRFQVAAEVLSESVLVAGVGGIWGAFSGVVLLRVLAAVTGLSTRAEWTTVLLGLTAAFASGVVAGLYPARRASRVPVVTAMRTE